MVPKHDKLELKIEKKIPRIYYLLTFVATFDSYYFSLRELDAGLANSSSC
jgi:hypothetical protein